MEVDEKSAAGTIKHQGQSYSFCSQRCLEKFRADPSRFVKPTLRLRLLRKDPVTPAPASRPDRVCLPDAPADLSATNREAARSAAWALEPSDDFSGRKRKPRAPRDDPAILVQPWASDSRVSCGNVRGDPGNPLHQLAPARFWTCSSSFSRGPVILWAAAVLCPRLAVDREPKPEYVHS